MRPGLLCGLACCAGLLVTVPAGAKEDPKAKRAVPDKATAKAPKLTAVPGFKAGIAAIVSDKSSAPSYAWSDVDRSHLVDQFRLPAANQDEQQSSEPLPSRIVDLVRRHDTMRSTSFGFDGGSQNLGPPVDAAARLPEVVAYHMSEVGACYGLMPNVSCNTIGGDDLNVRLALAYDF